MKRKGEYRIRSLETLMFDGDYYTVVLKNGEKRNKVTYHNPTRYLRIFPHVDEIIDFNNLLETIKNSLGIWKD